MREPTWCVQDAEGRVIETMRGKTKEQAEAWADFGTKAWSGTRLSPCIAVREDTGTIASGRASAHKEEAPDA